MRLILSLLSITFLHFATSELVIEAPIVPVSNTGLEDDLQFLFKWHPSSNLLSLDDELTKNIEFLNFKTNKNENYKCAIPISDELANSKKATDQPEETRIQTANLLLDFHQKKLCSYRVRNSNL